MNWLKHQNNALNCLEAESSNQSVIDGKKKASPVEVTSLA
jgi:hypothetical protein